VLGSLDGGMGGRGFISEIILTLLNSVRMARAPNSPGKQTVFPRVFVHGEIKVLRGLCESHLAAAEHPDFKVLS